MLEKLKTLIGPRAQGKEPLLRILLDQSEEEVVNYTHNYQLNLLENVILNIAIWKFNRLGTEGVDSENYSGVSFNYSTDYPDSIKKQLQAYRRIKTVG